VCRVRCDSELRFTRTSVELDTTEVSVILGTLRVIQNSEMRCARTSVDLDSSELLVKPGRVSDCAHQSFPLNQEECGDTVGSELCCTRTSVELHSTELSVIPGTV